MVYRWLLTKQRITDWLIVLPIWWFYEVKNCLNPTIKLPPKFHPVKSFRSHQAKRYSIELEIGFRSTHFSITGKFLNKKRSRPGYSSLRSLFSLEKVHQIQYMIYCFTTNLEQSNHRSTSNQLQRRSKKVFFYVEQRTWDRVNVTSDNLICIIWPWLTFADFFQVRLIVVDAEIIGFRCEHKNAVCDESEFQAWCQIS